MSAALFAVAFRGTIGFVLQLIAGAGDVVSAMSRAPIWLRLVLPAAGGLLAGLLGVLVARAPAGHGVGDVMEAVVLGHVRLSMRVTLLESAASWLAITSGGSLGREGPLIQFGGAAGKLVSERLGLPISRARLLIAPAPRPDSRPPTIRRSRPFCLLAGLAVAWMPVVAGNFEPLDALLDGRFAVGFMAMLLVGKCLATTASVSSGSPGGVFTPTLLLGGGIGFLYARLLLHTVCR